MTLLQGFPDASVLVIGDVMLDEYVWGKVERVSPEAPVPVVEFEARTHVVGGAANAAANVASLSGSAFLGGVIGSDIEADVLREELKRCHIEAHLVRSEDRPTTTKTRVIGGSQQILRIDREIAKEVSREAESSLVDWTRSRLSSMDCLLISDYGKGVVTPGLCHRVIDLARAEGKPVVVDPKGRDYSKYAGATVVTPNSTEIRLAVEPLGFSSGELGEDVSRLQSLLEGSSLLVTRGSDGVSLFQPHEPVLHVPARARTVFDVTGAGDTFVATLSLALGVGASLADAVVLANAAAGVVVGKVGTGTVDLAELGSELARTEGTEP